MTQKVVAEVTWYPHSEDCAYSLINQALTRDSHIVVNSILLTKTEGPVISLTS